MRHLLLLCLVIVSFASCNIAKVAIDKGMTAIDGGDYTALVEGCGGQLVSGFTYCRKREGSAADDIITLVSPNPSCKTKPCVTYKIFFPDGNPSLGGAFPDNSRSVSIKWSRILGRETFEVGDRGWWPFIYRIKYVGSDGNEREAVTEGEIRLRVIRKEYVALHNVEDDSNFVWKFKFNGTDVRMTSGGRTFVSKKK